MASLGRALDVYRRWRNDPDADDPDTVLGKHPELADLLDPLLAETGPEPSAEDSEELTELDGYEIEGELGRGGMGVVYRARDRALGRRVALKILAPHLTGDPRSLARFRREASTVAALDHPGIVEIYSVGEVEGRSFFAMELVRGAALDQLIHRLRTQTDRTAAAVGAAVAALGDGVGAADDGEDHTTGEPSTASRIATASADQADAQPFANGSMVQCMVALGIQLCEAVAHAHGAGVLHRDIKPANVLVTPEGRVVLTDFGLARTGDVPSVTVTGQFAGTPYYVSPEQARGDWATVGTASDVFSLGATLFEMLLLQRAFEAGSAQEVLDRIRSSAPVATQEMRSRLPRDLTAILCKALEKNPGERYPSAHALADDLRAYAEMRPVSARQRGPIRRAWRWARREPLRASLAVLLALGVPTVVGLGGYLLAKSPAIELGEREHAAIQRQRTLTAAYAQLLDDPWHQDAETGFRALLQDDPRDLDAAVGLALSVLGRATGEDHSFADLLRTAGVDPDQHAVLRAIAAQDGDALRDAASRDGSAAAWHAAGVFLFVVGKSEAKRDVIEQGMALLHRAVLLAPRPVETYLSSLAHCAHALRMNGTVTQVADALGYHFPDSVHAATSRALLLAELEPELALAAAEHAVEMAPTSTIARARLAALHHEAGRLDRAVELYRAILADTPDHPLAITNLCLIAVDRGQPAEAERQLEALARHRPDDPMIPRIRGRLAIARGDDEAAIAAYRDGTKVRDLDASAVHEFAGALLRSDRAAEALAVVRRAQALAPEDPRLAMRAAQALLQTEGPEAARAELEASTLLTSGGERQHRALSLLGAIDAMDEQWEQAAASLAAAQELGPLTLEASRNLLICLAQLERIDDGVAAGHGFVARFPDDARLHGALMNLLFMAGDGRAILDERIRYAEALRDRSQLGEAVRVMEAMLPLPPPPTIPEDAASAFLARLDALRRQLEGGG